MINQIDYMLMNGGGQAVQPIPTTGITNKCFYDALRRVRIRSSLIRMKWKR